MWLVFQSHPPEEGEGKGGGGEGGGGLHTQHYRNSLILSWNSYPFYILLVNYGVS
jgi:hypothetical protein